MRTLSKQRRAGGSLLELLVALGLFAVVGGAILRAMDRQARFHASLRDLLESRAQLAVTHEAVAAELRALSPVAFDIERITDSAVVYRALVGTAIACVVSATEVVLAPEVVASGQVMGKLRTAPQPGDTLWILDEGASPAAGDDAWVPLEIAGSSRLTGACLGTPVVDSTRDAARSGWRLTAAAPAASRPAPTAVFLTRRARMALYRASSGEPSLGWSDWNVSSGGWNAIQPLAGPFVPYNRASPAASGIAFRAVDSTGRPVTGPTVPIAAIGLAVRTRTAAGMRMDGLAPGRHLDSLHSLTALRNRE